MVEQAHATTARPKKLMGTLTLAFMVVAMASPIGVVVGTVPLMIGLGNGIGTPGTFAVIGIVLIVFAFGFSAIARALPSAGGFFGFIRAGLGSRVGMAAGFVATSAYGIITVFVAALLSYYVSTFFASQLGLPIDWAVWAVVLVAVAAVLLFLGIKESALVTVGLLTVEFIMLAVLAVAVLVQQGFGAFPLASFSIAEIFSGSPGLALALGFLCFVGFEVTAVFTNHVRDPQKTIGRATMVGIVILVLVFSLGAWVVIAGLGVSQALEIAAGPDVGQMVPIAATQNIGAWMGFLFNVFIMTSLLATLIVVFNTTAQYTQKLSSDLKVGSFLGRIHPRHGSPANAGAAVAAVLALVLIVCRIANLDPYVEIAALLGVLGAVAIFALEIVCAIAIFAYFRRARDRRVWTSMLSPAIATVALTVFLVLVLANYASLTGNTTLVGTWSPLLYVVFAAVGWFVGGRRETPVAADGAGDDVTAETTR